MTDSTNQQPQHVKTQTVKSQLGKLANLSVWFCFAVFFIWAIGALIYSPLLPQSVSFWAAGFYALAAAAYICFSQSKLKARAIVILTFMLIYAASLLAQPSNDRNWARDQANIANVKIENGIVNIENFRHCHYRTEADYDVRFANKEFPLDSIQAVWFIVQKFTASEGLAHVFLSFELSPKSEPRFFCVSIEVRREEGEFYDPIRGLYRNYELTHIVGDERDMIGVRTVHRPNDRVHMYRVNATAEQAQSLFVQFANRIQSLNQNPQFYNSLLNNCANGITGLTYDLTPEPINWLDSRIVLPGYSGQFAFASGLIGDQKNGQTFELLNAQSRIDIRARENGINESFSRAIRRQD